MKIIIIYTYLIAMLTLHITAASAQEKTIGFYNVENLFDIENDETINDEEFLPDGANEWDAEKYANKLIRISEVLSAMNLDIIGVSEVENRKVLEDLVTHPNMVSLRYQIIHFNSPDYRGIDVALLYKPSVFKPFSTAMIPIFDPEEPGFKTRDILLVKGLMDTDTISVFVNHWPSRRGGKEDKRILAAQVLRNAVDSLLSLNPQANIVCVGDFNDDPTNKSLKKVLNAVGKMDKLENNALYNPSTAIYKKGYGTGVYNGVWNLFDQVIISENLAKTSDDGFNYIPGSFTIFAPRWMQVQEGPGRGSPYRNFSYGAYQNGYSDHYPVFIKIN
ncbi:MAG: endonuclease/exonuclease/phosphatase family protein [Bacteroidota bacterium]